MLIQCTVHSISFAVVLTNHCNSLSMATVVFFLLKSFSRSQAAVSVFQSCGIPVPKQKGKGVREVAGSVWGLKDSKCPCFQFWSMQRSCLLLQERLMGTTGSRQAMPALWIWHHETRPSAADSAASSSPWLRDNLYSYKKFNCSLLSLVWASRKKGIHIPNHRLKTTAAFAKILVGNWRQREGVTDPGTSTWAKSDWEA